MLHLYNTLTRAKERFEPREAGRVGMYVCGITVYDFIHVGHARMFVVFDVLYRYLRHLGYQVRYVRNITDIDDKIIRRAQERGESIQALTDRFIAAMHEDAERLNVLPPDLEPRATGAVASMVEMIQRLLDQGYAYPAANGDIYYDVSRFPGYGRLSGKQLEDLRAGSRVEVEEAKDDPLDFVLWKAAKPGEPVWDAPWGQGRPGWHIECSAMSTQCLGNHFDIHGGGQDLQFPHHENEIAQSEAATGETFVNYWLHNGFVRVNEEKMSKSLGNFFTVRDVLASYAPEVLRYFIVASHYRSPLNYGDLQLDAARSALERLYTALRGTAVEPGSGAEHADARADTPIDNATGAAVDLTLAGFAERFRAAMDDDLNTPEALAVCFELAREVNRLKLEDEAAANRYAGQLKSFGAVLGLLQDDPQRFLQTASGPGSAAADEAGIEALIEARAAARKARDFAEADRIRAVLRERGIVLEDQGGKTTWRREG